MALERHVEHRHGVGAGRLRHRRDQSRPGGRAIRRGKVTPMAALKGHKIPDVKSLQRLFDTIDGWIAAGAPM